MPGILDTALGRQAKLLACVFALENKLDTIRSAAPPYQLSDELKTNVNNYGVAIMLSINISAYKGDHDVPHNHVLNILKWYQFDLPAGIEHDYANWEKISTFSHARVKKLCYTHFSNRLRTADSNIFTLAQEIVHSTPCLVHVECNSNEKYPNLIDKHLKFIRSMAGSSASKTVK
ncbi:hypothetical protein L208DRAFT_1424052 [Tricholoma matsutake]|nr:hypothetical protein L208DRAFT_1424052 [Tricholoma matsutake 945]